MKYAGTPKPTIAYDPCDLWMEFPFSPEYLQIIASPSEPEGSSVKTSVEASVKTGEKTPGKHRESVGKASGKILDACGANPVITIPEIAAQIGITERSIERNIHKLKADGFLRRIGGRKEGHWEVLK